MFYTLLFSSFALGLGGSLLSSTFSDSMVLQRGTPNVIWGFTTSGSTVNVSIDGTLSGSGTADATGIYRATIAPRAASLTPVTIDVTSSGGGSATLQDVLFGDVFLCSGVSIYS